MISEIHSNLYGFLKFLLICPLAGWMMTIVLFEVLKNLQGNSKHYETISKSRKIRCWLYLSLFAACVGLLIQSFS